MRSMTNSTNPATTSPTGRRQARPVSASERLFEGMAPLRRDAVRRCARWLPDAASAVDVAVWEAIHAGVTDRLALYNVARYAAVTHRRSELRHSRRLPAVAVESEDPAHRAVEVVDGQLRVRELLAKVPAPSRDVWAWIDRKAHQTVGEPLPSRVKMAGARWAAAALRELEVCDDVA